MKRDVMRAIRYQCSECMGYDTSEIVKCTSPSCPLFPFRFGRDPFRKRTETYKLDVYQWSTMRKNQNREDWKGMPENNDNNS